MTEEEILLKIAAFRAFSQRKTSKDTFDNVINKTQLDFYKEPTNIYLFQTEFNGINKFGITKYHPDQRASSSSKGKEFYKKLLFKLELKDRYTAIAVEQAFKSIFENRSIFGNLGTTRSRWKSITYQLPDDWIPAESVEVGQKILTKSLYRKQNNLTKEQMEDLIIKIEDTKKLLGVSSENRFDLKYLSERVGITELTKMNEVEFERKINEIIYSYEELNIWEFTKKYFPSQMKNIQKEVDEVLVKKEVIWITRRDNLVQYQEYDYSEYNCEDPKTRIRRKKLTPPFNLKDKPGNDSTDEYVPINELPFIFNKYFDAQLF